MTDFFSKIAKHNGIKKKKEKKNELAVIINDTIRLFTVFISAHVLQTLLHEDNKLFNKEFIKTIMYFALGTLIYHILVKKYTQLEEQ